MTNILFPAERIARIINLLTPSGIWYYLIMENEEAGDERTVIHLQYCVVHPEDISEQDVDEAREFIHDLYVDWIDYSDEKFLRKLDEMKHYVRFCRVLEHQDNYEDLTPREKAEFVEAELVKYRNAIPEGLPF